MGVEFVVTESAYARAPMAGAEGHGEAIDGTAYSHVESGAGGCFGRWRMSTRANKRL